MKKLYLMVFATLMIFLSCSTDNKKQGTEPGTDNSETAYLSMDLFGTKSIGVKSDPGTATGEDKVNDVTILYFDETDKFLGSSGRLFPSAFTQSINSYRTANPIEVPRATAKVFVIINNYDASGSVARFAVPGNEKIGALWSALNSTLSFTPIAVDGVNEFVNSVSGKLTDNTTDNFTMVNYGVRYSAPGVLNIADHGLIAVVTKPTPAEAKEYVDNNIGANTVYVDRLASKVVFKIIEINAPGAGEVAATPANAKFFFQGWEMNATNRKMRLYSEHDASYTGVDPAGGFLGYRKDANYTKDTYGAIGSDWTGYENQFVFLRNTALDGTGTTSVVGNAPGTVKYCPENTMTADAQLIGATTNVIVKGNYVPDGFTANDSYFMHDGKYYTLDQIKTAYASSSLSGHNQGIAKDMDNFMKASLLVTGSPTDLELENAVANLIAGTASTELNEKTGIIGRVDNAVRYFHNGVSYYSILIRHDQRVTTPMALARYGTVRNNWYDLTLNKINRPGSPWIPGGPDVVPTDPKPDTPDDNFANLDVTIAVNPWTTWSQLIDL